MLTKVEETLENDELGATSVRESIEDALEESGLLRARSPEDTRQYVDALLDAITEEDRTEATPGPGTTEDGDSIVPEESALADDSHQEEAEEGAAEEHGEDFEQWVAVLEGRDVTNGHAAEVTDEAEVVDQDETDEAVPEAEETASAVDEATSQADESTSGVNEVTHGVDDGAPEVDEVSSVDEGLTKVTETVPEDNEAAPVAVDDTIEKPIDPELSNEPLTASDDPAVGTEQSEEVIELDAESESIDVLTESQDQPEPSPSSSLKELLVRLTKQVRTPPAKGHSVVTVEETGSDVTPADALKLRNFGRILSELTASTQTTTAPEDVAADTTDIEENVETEVATAEQTKPSNEDVKEPKSKKSKPKKGEAAKPDLDVTGWTLSVRHHVGKEYVSRPASEDARKRWTLQFSISEMPRERSKRIYEQLVNRRTRRYSATQRTGQAWHEMWGGKLKQYVRKGIEFRQQEEKLAQKAGVYVYPAVEKVPWSSALTNDRKAASKGQSAKESQ
jgi:hypothetical protein